MTDDDIEAEFACNEEKYEELSPPLVLRLRCNESCDDSPIRANERADTATLVSSPLLGQHLAVVCAQDVSK